MRWIVELTHETMPARMQPQVERTMCHVVKKAIEKNGLHFMDVEPQDVVVHATPQRMVVIVKNVQAQARETLEDGDWKQGPRVDAPQQALDGFMRHNGIKNLDEECEKRPNKKGVVCYFFYKIPPPPIDCLPRVLEDILLGMKWQKSMRWGEGRFAWVRPIRAIASVYGTKKLKGGFFLGDDTTPPQYMETHSNEDIFLPFYKLADGNDYDHLSRKKRREDINEMVRKIAEDLNLKPQQTIVTITMAGLSENPVMLSCPLPELAQTLPNEVIQAVCDAQYGVIPLINEHRKITHVAFLTDNAPTKSHATIIEGYKTLLAARLADADFYIKRDQQKPLQHYADQLERMTFHTDLGNMLEKTKRMADIIHRVTGKHLDEAQQLTQLAKADLTTQMVAEFPSLQGIIGAHYYSKEKNHDKEWAKAIRDHYRPFSMEDDIPASELGCALALADKLDTVVRFFEAGKIPTGSKDPYALRRAAIGIACILVEQERLKKHSLKALIDINAKSSSNQKEDIYLFIGEQMCRYLPTYHSYGYDSRAIVAVLQMKQPMTVAEQMERSKALYDLFYDKQYLNKQYDNFRNVYIRAKHFAKEAAPQEYDFSLCQDETEQAVYVQWQKATSEKDFYHRLKKFEALHEPIEAFCATVKVFDDDEKQRANRIALMNDIKEDLNKLCNMEKFTNLLNAPAM